MAREYSSWATAITEIKPNEIHLRGYRVEELMGNVPFAHVIYLALTGTLPTAEVGELLDAILVSSVDHGVTPPSTLATRTASSTGAPLNAAVAAGILTINRFHGGAIEDCMHIILQALERLLEEDDRSSWDQAAAEMVTEYRAENKRLAGFGHRVHSGDPRAARLFDLAERLNIAAGGVKMVQALQQVLSRQIGRKLPINVDGAIAALLVDMELPAEYANGLFVVARVPGLLVHAIEESDRERPMRHIDATNHTYDGPPTRQFEPNPGTKLGNSKMG